MEFRNLRYPYMAYICIEMAKKHSAGGNYKEASYLSSHALGILMILSPDTFSEINAQWHRVKADTK